MGAVLAVLSNPVVSKLAGGLINKLFNRKGKNGKVDGKVAGTAASGTIVTIILSVIAIFNPGLVEVLRGAELAAVVAGLITLIGATIGYFKPSEE